MCGEKCMRSKATLQPLGSPPRVRGKVSVNVPIFALQRITPACAGKSKASRNTAVQFWDHPRVCGEKTTTWLFPVATMGSPPRVRGKAALIEHISCEQRITPACAGKRLQSVQAKRPIWDHPRVCGEKSYVFLRFYLSMGSPPRVRGKASRARRGRNNRRITPACAGKSTIQVSELGADEDHPRVCGEKGRVPVDAVRQ